jgi:tight adherence protein C
MEIEQTIGLLAFFIGIAVFFLMYALYAPVVERTTENEKLVNLFEDEDEEYNYDEEMKGDSIGKYIRPILNNFLPTIPRIPLSNTRKQSLNKLIVQSGNPWKLNGEELIGLMIAFSIIGFMIGIVLLATGTMPEMIPGPVIVVLLAAMGGALPYSKYNSAKEARTKAIEKELPEALDLLKITINSGQTFEHAMESVTKQLPKGVLREEFQRVVIEMQAGSSMERAFKSLTSRFKSEDLESFSKAVIQTTKLGSDVSDTLKHQADYVRANYEARLQRMIARLETTMFIPLIGTMLPAFMIIIIAPVLMSIFTYL